MSHIWLPQKIGVSEMVFPPLFSLGGNMDSETGAFIYHPWWEYGVIL